MPCDRAVRRSCPLGVLSWRRLGQRRHFHLDAIKAINAARGDAIVVGLDLGNLSDAPANAMLSLSVPSGIDVEVTSDPLGDDIKEAQLSAREWLVTVTSLARAAPDDSLDITISPKDGLKPGFSTITGRIVQVAN